MTNDATTTSIEGTDSEDKKVRSADIAYAIGRLSQARATVGGFNGENAILACEQIGRDLADEGEELSYSGKSGALEATVEELDYKTDRTAEAIEEVLEILKALQEEV